LTCRATTRTPHAVTAIVLSMRKSSGEYRPKGFRVAP
jgi:hypothetical protein